MNCPWWKKEIGDLNGLSSLGCQNLAAVKKISCIQVALICVACMLLDGGKTLNLILLAALGWWVGVLFILLRSSENRRFTDQLFLKAGFFLLMLVSFFAQPLWVLLRR